MPHMPILTREFASNPVILRAVAGSTLAARRHRSNGSPAARRHRSNGSPTALRFAQDDGPWRWPHDIAPARVTLTRARARRPTYASHTRESTHASPHTRARIRKPARPCRRASVATLPPMLLLLSPAKSLDYESPLPEPVLAARAALKPAATAPDRKSVV